MKNIAFKINGATVIKNSAIALVKENNEPQWKLEKPDSSYKYGLISSQYDNVLLASKDLKRWQFAVIIEINGKRYGQDSVGAICQIVKKNRLYELE